MSAPNQRVSGGGVSVTADPAAATAAKQDTGNASLASIDGKITAVNTGAVVVSSSALPSGAANQTKQDTANTSLASIDGKITAVNTGAVVVSSSALPSGAATSAKQDTGNTSVASVDTKLTTTNSSLASIDGKITAVNTGAVVVSSSALPTGAATETTLSAVSAKFGTLGQKAMAGSAPVVLASDQAAIPVSQSSTWNVTNVSGTVSLPTGAATAAKQPALGTAGSASADVISIQGVASMTPVQTKASGKTALAKARNAYASTSVTTGAYVELISSVGSTAVTEVEIFDSSGQTLLFATGAGASEVDQIYITPGGNGRVPLAIAANTRVAVKAVSATASVGELTVNFYG